MRRWIDEHRGLVGLMGMVVVFAIAAFVFFSRGDSESGSSGDEVWFTTDDGKTWFAMPSSTLAPAEKDGKTAVRAHVFVCEGEKYVGYLERLSPDAARRIKSGMFDPMLSAAIEVKAPGTGDTGWLRISDPAAAGLMQPKCPKHPGKPVAAVHP